MDGVHVVHSESILDEHDFGCAIKKLSHDEKWKPILWTNRQSLNKMLGRDVQKYIDRTARMRSDHDANRFNAEIFLLDSKGLVFVVNEPTETLSGPGTFEARRQLERYFGPSNQPVRGILVGVVSGDHKTCEVEVEQFCIDFESALRSSVDGRRARHFQFNWRALTSHTAGPRNILDRLREDEVGLRFVAPTDPDDEIRARVSNLTDSTARILLREISESRFARHADLLSSRGKREAEFTQALETIKEAGLVTVEYLLQCRKTSAQLVRVKDIEELSMMPAKDFRCASCNRTFSEELTSEGYSLSSEVRNLVQGSHWMTIWVTGQLINMGVPKENILWNVEDSGEEVDILIEYLGKIWVFELKDREFGAGDAYPFNYRKVRYNASAAVVVTTEKIAPDARRVFADLRANPVLVEGLATFNEAVQSAFNKFALTTASHALLIPSAVSGIDLPKWYSDSPSS